MVKNLLGALCALLFWAKDAGAQFCSDVVYPATTTYYTPGLGYCTLPTPDTPVYVVAVSPALYDTALGCGACMQISSSRGTIIGQVGDLCPSCTGYNLDISADASLLLDSIQGITPIQWRYVGCPVSGPVKFVYQGSNPYYIKVQVRNHRYPINKLEVRGNSGVFMQLPKTEDNFFSSTWPSGPENGPYDFRITNILGDTILETGIPLLTNNDSVFTGTNQFAVCINETTGVTALFHAASNVEVMNTATNTLSVLNNNSHALSFQVCDLLGRVVATGAVTGNSKQAIRIEQAGIYIVSYSAPQFGREAKRVMVR